MELNGPLENVAKNEMLDKWRIDTVNGGVFIKVKVEALGSEIESGPISFNPASNGKLTLAEDIVLTIPSGASITEVNLLRTPNGGTTWVSQIDWEFLAVEFPNGGDLIINQLDIELVDF